MFEDDLRSRAYRILAGDIRVTDLDRLFLGLRAKAGGNHCFREIGDFVAHRDKREKGVTFSRVKDLYTSVEVWSRGLRKLPYRIDDFEQAGLANLRLATDEQIRNGCDCNRSQAAARFKSGMKKLRREQGLKRSEHQAVAYLADRFIWNIAFTPEQVVAEAKDVFRSNAIVREGDIDGLDAVKQSLALYVITVMHGSSIEVEEGKELRLFAGFANSGRFLEVRVEIAFEELDKPMWAPIPLFRTEIKAEDGCSPELISQKQRVLYNHWNGCLELGSDGRLVGLAAASLAVSEV